MTDRGVPLRPTPRARLMIASIAGVLCALAVAAYLIFVSAFSTQGSHAQLVVGDSPTSSVVATSVPATSESTSTLPTTSTTTTLPTSTTTPTTTTTTPPVPTGPPAIAVGPGDSGRTITVEPGQMVRVSLPVPASASATGWKDPAFSHDGIVTLVSNAADANGDRNFVLQGAGPGNTEVVVSENCQVPGGMCTGWFMNISVVSASGQ